MSILNFVIKNVIEFCNQICYLQNKENLIISVVITTTPMMY